MAVFFLCVALATGFASQAEKLLVVLAPVADIRSVPQDGKGGYAHDDRNQTQVLYNEILVYKGERGDWYQVEALEQKEYSHNRSWQGYPGWIRKEKAGFIDTRPEYNIVVSAGHARILKDPASSAQAIISVSLGTRFTEIGRQEGYYKVRLSGGAIGWIPVKEAARIDAAPGESLQRQNIVTEAKFFLGKPYLWGGRSSSAVDCSGLVNLAYRASGVDVPRDAHEQWMLANPISADELKPADLIFLSKKDDDKTIAHVMLYIGNGDCIEAPGTGKKVRIGSLKDYPASGKKMYFGRFLP